MRIHGIPMRGYEDVLRESTKLDLDPTFDVLYEFGYETNGLRYPSQIDVNVTYTVPHLKLTIEKISAKITYKKFRFFSVETDHRIKLP